MYLEGLANVESYTHAAYGKRFVELSEDQQDGVLKDVESGRATVGSTALAPFFGLVLTHTLEGMFGDPQWGGNHNFVGWELIGYPGPRYTWEEADQQLDAVIGPLYRSAIDLELDRK
jgi:gluconate 2-dehydrogenase gamma chain